MRTLRPLTHASTHDLVINLLRRDFPSGGRARKLLDAPCGTGALSMRMGALRFEVSCCDIDPGHFHAAGLAFTQADLNRPLPFRDQQFDVVVSVAGLQRVYSPDVMIRELARILGPGGTLYLTIPNYSSLRLRLRFLLYGSLGTRFDEPAYHQTTGAAEANFRFPLTYPRVERLLCGHGFALRSIEVDRAGRYLWLLFPISLAFSCLARLKALSNQRLYGPYRRGTTVGMLHSRAFVITATKMEAPAADKRHAGPRPCIDPQCPAMPPQRFRLRPAPLRPRLPA
jgi:SAM-dependent methyltransferase